MYNSIYIQNGILTYFLTHTFNNIKWKIAVMINDSNSCMLHCCHIDFMKHACFYLPLSSISVRQMNHESRMRCYYFCSFGFIFHIKVRLKALHCGILFVHFAKGSQQTFLHYAHYTFCILQKWRENYDSMLFWTIVGLLLVRTDPSFNNGLFCKAASHCDCRKAEKILFFMAWILWNRSAVIKPRQWGLSEELFVF